MQWSSLPKIRRLVVFARSYGLVSRKVLSNLQRLPRATNRLERAERPGGHWLRVPHQGLSSQQVFRAQPQCQPLVVAGRRANRLVRSRRSRIPRKQQQQQHSPSNDIHPTPVVGEDPIQSQGASPTPASGLSRARPCGLSKGVRESSLIFAANAIRRWEARMDAVIVWWSPLCSS
jgi:hypothetical protein